MRTYSYHHFDDNEEVETSARTAADGKDLNLEIAGQMFFLQHWQLLDLRDKITAALAASPFKCHFPNCEEERDSHTCMSCDRKGCDEHMTAVFSLAEGDEILGYLCDTECPDKKEKAA